MRSPTLGPHSCIALRLSGLGEKNTTKLRNISELRIFEGKFFRNVIFRAWGGGRGNREMFVRNIYQIEHEDDKRRNKEYFLSRLRKLSYDRKNTFLWAEENFLMQGRIIKVLGGENECKGFSERLSLS